MHITSIKSVIPDDLKRIQMLIASPSPRNIPAFNEAVDDELEEYDVVLFKYFPQASEPYKRIKRYFLKRKRYTHLAILPDDLVVDREGVNKLVELVLSDPRRYTVVMGNCFVEYGLPSLQYIFTSNLPALKREDRKYDWIPAETPQVGPVVTAPYCGTPFAILSREVVEKVTFDTDLKWNKFHGNVGFSEDVVLAHDLKKFDIPIYVHTGAFFDHLKGKPEAAV